MLRFNQHFELEGRHAFLGASKYHWIRYDADKMKQIWANQFKSQRGTRIHNVARILINEKVKLERNSMTLNMYVNDAIGLMLTPEVPLMFSQNAFGTADAAGFDTDTKIFRVHDLKTGDHPGNFDQLRIYCAFFWHEYLKPTGLSLHDITFIMRIYQSDTLMELHAEPNELQEILDKLTEFDPIIEVMREEME